MKRERHKRKNSHVVIVTSDAVDASVKQFRIRPWVSQALLLLLCVGIGALSGYFFFMNGERKEQIKQAAQYQELQNNLELEKEILIQQKADLEAQVASLEETVQLLSETVNQKVMAETELSEQLEKQLTPTEFPLNCSATMEFATEGDPMCIFTTIDGAMVIATAGGTVTAVNDDTVYGKNVWVDHGNGYVTIYRNQGEVKVKQGETVTRGTTLFLINGENSKLGYQMLKDGEYIDPMEMLAISG